MEQSPSWEPNWFAASQEIPHISRNPKVHYRTHKRPPTISILGQPNPVHIPTSHVLEIHRNIIHPSTPRSPQVVSFPPVSPPRPYTPPSPHPYAPHAHPISFFSIVSPAQYWVRSTDHLSPYYLPSIFQPFPASEPFIMFSSWHASWSQRSRCSILDASVDCGYKPCGLESTKLPYASVVDKIENSDGQSIPVECLSGPPPNICPFATLIQPVNQSV